MRAQPNRRGSAALLAAVGGVLVGHWLTYRLVSPHAGAADQLLKGTGHAYLGYLNDLVLVGALGALAAIFLGRLIQRDGEPPRYRTLAARLIAFQGAAFVAMEAIERLASGSPLASLLHHGLLPAGIAIQALVALAIALLIHLLLRAADIVAAALLSADPRSVHDEQLPPVLTPGVMCPPVPSPAPPSAFAVLPPSSSP